MTEDWIQYFEVIRQRAVQLKTQASPLPKDEGEVETAVTDAAAEDRGSP